MKSFVLITGNDEYSVKLKSIELLSELCGTPPENDPCLEVVHGDRDDRNPMEIARELLAAIGTPAFLGSSKTVWLKHFSHFQLLTGKNSTAEKLKHAFKEVSDFISAGIPEDLVLVIDGPGLDRRSSFFKAASKYGTVLYFEKADISSKGYTDLLMKRAREYADKNGFRIEEEALDYIILAAGSDTSRLYMELDKLFSYVGVPEKHINLQDCREICSRTPETLNWVFSDALGMRNSRKAIEAISLLVDQQSGANEISLLLGFVHRFEDMVAIRTDAEKLNIPLSCAYPSFRNITDSPPPDMAEEMKDSPLFRYHPYRAWKSLQDSAKFSEEEIKGILTMLVDANRKLVSGGGSPRIVLEQLSMSICSGNFPR